MNTSKFQDADGCSIFTLNDQLMPKLIAEKHKGDFDQCFFVIDNFIKHVNAKGYNRHVVTGSMKLSELLSVRQEALGLLLLENYWEPWEQLVTYIEAR
jgi:hypothetical protein